MNECISKILAGKHALVVGMTGSGKTWWMAKVCENLPCYVFVNVQEERIVDTITDALTDEADEVIELFEEGYRKVQFLPSDDTEVAINQLEIIRRDLVDAGRDMQLGDGVFWVDYIIDEIHEFAWLGSRNDLENVFRRGRRYGIRGWALSQMPQNIAKAIVNNTDNAVIFELGTFAEPYYKLYRIPIAEHRQWIEKKYHYVTWDRKTMRRCKPII